MEDVVPPHPWVLRARDLRARARLDGQEAALLVTVAGQELQTGPGPDGAVTGCRTGTTASALLASSGCPPLELHALLGPAAPLVRSGLLEVEDGVPLSAAVVRVAPRVLRWLGGEDDLHEDLRPFSLRVPLLHCVTSRRIEAGLRSQHGRCVVVRERPGGLATAAACDALSRAGLGCLALDLDLALPGDDLEQLVALALTDALLLDLGLVLSPYDVLVATAPRALRLLAEPARPVVLTGTVSWGPTLVRVPPLLFDSEDWEQRQRRAVWAQVLGQDGEASALPEDLVAQSLRPVQVVRAVERAHLAGDLGAASLLAAAREESTGALTRLARALQPVAAWDDLVVPPLQRRQLEQVVERVRTREVVRSWGVGGRSTARRGTVALFGGAPGTGKTLAVEVVARELGLLVFAVDLATVVDKYVGETEKNLDAIFREAAGVQAVLFFDEADALFAKRGQVNDAHDRYANLQVAFLLQRLEDFDGLAVLATNLASNLDEAVTRRVDSVVVFEEPDPRARRRLWGLSLGGAPLHDDVDLDLLASTYALTGGDIRNAAVAAAHACAVRGGVTQDALVAAVEDEYRKLGRLAPPAAGRAPGPAAVR